MIKRITILLIVICIFGCQAKNETESLNYSDMNYLLINDFNLTNVGLFSTWRPQGGLAYFDLNNMNWINIPHYQTKDNENFIPPNINIFTLISNNIIFMMLENSNRDIVLYTVLPDGTEERELFRINRNNNILEGEHKALYYQNKLFFKLYEISIKGDGSTEQKDILYEYDFEKNILKEIVPITNTIDKGYDIWFANENKIYFKSFYDLENQKNNQHYKLYSYDLVDNKIEYKTDLCSYTNYQIGEPANNEIVYYDNLNKVFLKYNLLTNLTERYDLPFYVEENVTVYTYDTIENILTVVLSDDNIHEACYINTQNNHYKCISEKFVIPYAKNDSKVVAQYYDNFDKFFTGNKTSEISQCVINIGDFNEFNFESIQEFKIK